MCVVPSTHAFCQIRLGIQRPQCEKKNEARDDEGYDGYQQRERLCNTNNGRKTEIKIQDSQFIYQFELNQCYWYFYRQYCLLSTADINIDGATPSFPHSHIPPSGSVSETHRIRLESRRWGTFSSLPSSSLLLLFFSRGDDVVGARTSGCEGCWAQRRCLNFFLPPFFAAPSFLIIILAQRLKSIQIHRWRRHLTHRADISLLAREYEEMNVKWNYVNCCWENQLRCVFNVQAPFESATRGKSNPRKKRGDEQQCGDREGEEKMNDE